MFHLSGTLRVPAPVPSPSPTNTRKNGGLYHPAACLLLGPLRDCLGARSGRGSAQQFPPGVGSPPPTPQTARPVAVSESDAQARGEREGEGAGRSSPASWPPARRSVLSGFPVRLRSRSRSPRRPQAPLLQRAPSLRVPAPRDLRVPEGGHDRLPGMLFTGQGGARAAATVRAGKPPGPGSTPAGVPWERGPRLAHTPLGELSRAPLFPGPYGHWLEDSREYNDSNDGDNHITVLEYVSNFFFFLFFGLTGHLPDLSSPARDGTPTACSEGTSPQRFFS